MATKWRETGDYYVDGISGDDANAGTKEAPYKTIGAATAAGSGTYKIVVVGTGVYNESINCAEIGNYTCIQGDGNPIIDCTGLTQGAIYNNYFGNVKDITFVNAGVYGIQHYEARHYRTNYTRCIFKDCLTFFGYGGNHDYGAVANISDCVFINFPRGVVMRNPGSNYVYGYVYTNCLFYNAPLSIGPGHLQGDDTSGPYNHYNEQACTRCWFDADGQLSGSGANTNYKNPTNGQFRVGFTRGASTTMGQYFENCFVGDGGLLGTGQGIEGGDGITFFTVDALIASASAVGRTARFFNTTPLQATASYNSAISGSGALTPAAYYITNLANSEIYAAKVQQAFGSLIGIQNPQTSFGYENSADNILHTAGGATWANITSSADGSSLQISSSLTPSGSITSAVIDLGGLKRINAINSSWTSTVANAGALAVHTASVANQFPTRYTFEMQYNSSSAMPDDYKIFEFDERIEIDLNGKGNGDVLFASGSIDSNGVNASHLQFRITLRTNLSGSI